MEVVSRKRAQTDNTLAGSGPVFFLEHTRVYLTRTHNPLVPIPDPYSVELSFQIGAYCWLSLGYHSTTTYHILYKMSGQEGLLDLKQLWANMRCGKLSPSLRGPARDAQASLREQWPGGEGHRGRWTERGREWVTYRRQDPLSVRETPGLAAHGPRDPAQGSQTQSSKNHLSRCFFYSTPLPNPCLQACCYVVSPQSPSQ